MSASEQRASGLGKSVQHDAVAELNFLSATALAALIAAREVSAVEVVEAHIARIEATHSALGAVVVPLFDEAHRAARRVDAALLQGESVGPLAGVPVTIKECFQVAGAASTLGVPRYSAARAASDAPLVAALRGAGAIVLGVTNVSQLMLLHETDNPLYGRTNNPWRLDRSPGGSSGGEAAVIAAGGSPWGLASDIGGSIRQPAHACGVHGLKPTTGRLTRLGKNGAFRGMEAIGAPPGPMARSVDDLERMLHVFVQAAPANDCSLPPVPLRLASDVAIDRLRIGYWVDDGYITPCPAARRAVDEAAAALRAAGADVELTSPPAIDEMLEIYFGLMSADGGADLRRWLGGASSGDQAQFDWGPVDWRVRRLLRYGALGRIPRGVLASLLELAGQPRLGALTRVAGRVSADRYWRLAAARADFANRFLDAMNRARFDAFLCPPHALPALRHGDSAYVSLAASYCYLPNLLNMPAGVVAATRVRAGEESDRPPSHDRVDATARAIEIGSAGLPIGVQVFARPWREDIVLATMGRLEAHFRQSGDYPSRPPL